MATGTEMDSEGPDPMDRDIGATWFELGLSFSAFSGLPLFWDIRAIARGSGLDRDFLVVRMLLRFLLLFCMVGLHICVTSVRLGSPEAFIGLSCHFRKPRNL